MTPLVAKMMMDPANNCLLQLARLFCSTVSRHIYVLLLRWMYIVSTRLEFREFSDEHKHSYVYLFISMLMICSPPLIYLCLIVHLSVLDMGMPIRGRGERDIGGSLCTCVIAFPLERVVFLPTFLNQL